MDLGSPEDVQLREIEPPDTGLAAPALRALRPHFDSDEAIVRQIDELQRAEGYRVAGIFVPTISHAVAVAGFRVTHSTSAGRHLYIDDLSTLSAARRHGFARSLLEWLDEEASRQDCTQVHLDSGVGPDRFDAHKLYHAHGFSIAAHHFVKSV